MTYRKKLIEVGLPLDAINKASAREKSIRHGHPSTLHLWWARRPLAAARAVIFAQMVDDPSAHPDLFPTEKKQEKERQRLFRIIEDLVQWENTTNETVLQKARDEIWQSWRRACAQNVDHPRAKELFNRNRLPAFHDPFAGGGSLPLEAQRLGLEAYASDLNPVAVLISKAMIEIPSRFAGRPPVNPAFVGDKGLIEREWRGLQGLAEDVRHYGKWMRDEAEKRVGHLYPGIQVTPEMAAGRPDLRPYVGKRLTVIAWLWARTVKSPNPAFLDKDVPLASTFLLSTKAGREAYVDPVIENGDYKFEVRAGKPKDLDQTKSGTKLARGTFRCLVSQVPIEYEYIDDEANAGRMGVRLMAIVAEGDRGRVYLSPTAAMEEVARSAHPSWKPETPSRGTWASNAQGRRYGFRTFGDYFTPRQLVALTTFSDLVGEAIERVRIDGIAAGLPDDGKALRDGGTGATAYAQALGVYLGFGSSRAADAWSSIVTWRNQVDATRNTFARQGLPMTWDFAEANPFSESCGHWMGNSVEWVQKSILHLPSRPIEGLSEQADATSQTRSRDKLISTDPPYYDNVGYADLSDFFYVWLRRSAGGLFPDLFATIAVPKSEELVASSYRHASADAAEKFFLAGMSEAMRRLSEQSHPAFPLTIYYAFKQSEDDGEMGTISTGWETFLDAVIRAGLGVTGTWPMRTEKQGRVTAIETNALASSIVLVCRPRELGAPIATRREFVAALKRELPDALRYLQTCNIAPVDLAQAAIGPGMAVFTRYSQVLDATGEGMKVRQALALINQTLDEALAEQEGDFDADTQWAVAWFDQSGFTAGEFGVADVLARAKNTSVQGMKDAGILDKKSPGGKVRLLKPSELPATWDPTSDARLTTWETVHHLIRVLEKDGESAAADLVVRLGSKAEVARELAYRLYTLCERKKRSVEARSYNGLVQSWPEIVRLARDGGKQKAQQAQLFEQE